MRYVALYGSLCRLRQRGVTCLSTWTGAPSQRLQGAQRAPGRSRVQREIFIKSGAPQRVSGPAHVRDMDGEENANTSHKEKKSRRHNVYVG